MKLNKRQFLVAALMLAFSGVVGAVGLGEVVRQPVLGERLVLNIPVLGDATGVLDADCFRVIRPQRGDDLPWVQQAVVSVRPGKPPMLELRAQQVVREPIMQLAIQILCGYEVWREYTLLASPPEQVTESPAPVRRVPPPTLGRSPTDREKYPGTAQVRRAPRLPASSSLLAPAVAVQGSVRQPVSQIVSELPGLRLATVLGEPSDALGMAAKRDLLRLEFRILMTLHDQALGQLDAAARLQQAEASLQALQGKTQALTEAAEAQLAPAPRPVPPAPPTALPERHAAPASRDASFFSGWAFYGLLLGVLFGLAAWGLRYAYHEYQVRKAAREFADDDFIEIDDELPSAGPGDESVRISPPSGGGFPHRGDDLLGRTGVEIRELSKELLSTAGVVAAPQPLVNSIGEATVDEQFSANPVMELADIMLSFGRVKGAAQALREYVDNNPQEELKPWMRLLDVYRMAGMRDEFELVAANLNRYFNVEVLSWEEQPVVAGARQPVPSLEDMPHLMGNIVSMWNSEDVVGYLYQLLRDNRGGQRQGFSVFVASEILFLIELKETANRIEAVAA